MQRWPRGLIAVILALWAATASVRPAAACSCVDPGPPSAAFNYMGVVFVGEVTAVTMNTGGLSQWFDQLRQWVGLPPASAPSGIYATLQVSDAWKGLTATPVQVVTSGGSASCGFDFQLNQKYVVYGWQDTYGLTTNSCTRTAIVTNAAADLAYLQTLPTLPLTAAASQLSLVLFGLLGAAGLGAAALIIAVALRRRAAPSKDNT